MAAKIKALNEFGIEVFRKEIIEIKSGLKSNLSTDLLISEDFSKEIPENIIIEEETFLSKKELIFYLHNRLEKITTQDKYYDLGLWSWLSVFFFDSICPKENDGKRNPGAIDRYILNVDHWGRYYRHLLAAPTRIYEELGDLSEIYLTGHSSTHGDLFEQLASRQEIATNPGVISAATILYWDEGSEKIKRGARSKKGGGILRRFTRDIIPQFQMTYDLNSMDGNEIIELLPSEFDPWLKSYAV